MAHFPVLSRPLLILTLLLAGTFAIHAQTTVPTTDVPRTISYQGLLTHNDGTPFTDGQYQVTVTLYGDKDGTIDLWQETYTTEVKRGVFNLYLGDNAKPLPAAAAMNTPLWIGTAVDGADEMRPLTPLSASPYALNVPDRAITTNKIAEKAITAEKVDMNYISELRIDGQKVSGNGTALNLVSTPAVPLSYDATTQTVTIGQAATRQKGDNEKGPQTLASPLAWNSGGDLTNGAIAPQATAAGDWLGTSAAGANLRYDLEIRVKNVKIMDYVPSTTVGAVPNILGGGVGNTIAAASNGSIIAGGGSTTILSPQRNTIVGNKDVIGGGESNDIFDGDYNVIAGGQDNDIAASVSYAAIGGGFQNRIEGSTAAIAGGDNNLISATSGGSFIGAGGNHVIDGLSYRSGIVTGEGNYIHESEFSFVGGGNTNSISDAHRSFIGGGEGNSLTGASFKSVIAGGGVNNVDNGPLTTIGGGEGNQVIDGDYNTIGGGFSNQITFGSIGAINGGQNNLIDGSAYGAIGGGYGNHIDPGSDGAAISGGQDNTVSGNADYASIGGGQGNIASGSHTTIPGGDLLTTNASYGQTAVGFFNKPRGSMGVRPNAATINGSKDPLFMVGNGNVSGGSAARSNAFEVSYNGHTTVYGVNGGVNPAITGATYTDNVIYAWADVPRVTVGGLMPMVANFGVATINRVAAGTYDVTISVTDPVGNPATVFNASVTAAIMDDVFSPLGCGMIITSRIGVLAPNVFRIWIYDDACTLTDRAFTFKVTGRP